MQRGWYRVLGRLGAKQRIKEAKVGVGWGLAGHADEAAYRVRSPVCLRGRTCPLYCLSRLAGNMTYIKQDRYLDERLADSPDEAL